jgi:hypothetical protein
MENNRNKAVEIVNTINENYQLNLLTVDSSRMTEDIEGIISNCKCNQSKKNTVSEEKEVSKESNTVSAEDMESHIKLLTDKINFGYKYEHLNSIAHTDLLNSVKNIKKHLQEYKENNNWISDVIDLKWLVYKGATHEELIERIEVLPNPPKQKQ